MILKDNLEKVVPKESKLKDLKCVVQGIPGLKE